MHKSSLSRALVLSLIWIANVADLFAQNPRGAVQAVLERMAPNRQLPADLILTGQLTDPYGVFPFRITIKGKDQARYEVGAGPSLVTMTLSKGAGWRETGGKIEPLQPYSSMQRPVLVPFLDLLAEADTAALQITDRGTVAVGGSNSRHFTLKLPDPSPRTRMFGRALDEETDIYVDPGTSLVVRSERWRMAENSMHIRFRVVTELSDYRNVQGLTVPFRIVETVHVQTRAAVQSVFVISGATVNSGVSESIFATPGSPR